MRCRPRAPTLYGGRYQVRQFDASVSGSLFHIWGGDVQLAVGVDYRRESYEFNGSPPRPRTRRTSSMSAFDNINALTPKHRTRDGRLCRGPVPDPARARHHRRRPDRRLYRLRQHDQSEGLVPFPPVGADHVPRLLRDRFPCPDVQSDLQRDVTVSPNPGNTLVDPTLCPTGQHHRSATRTALPSPPNR